MKIPLPPPEERKEREREALLEKIKANRESIEQIDPRGAVLTLLASVGIVHKAVPSTDTVNRQRIEALAEAVFETAASETLGVRSAQGMVDRLIQAVDNDWAKRGL